MNTKQLEYVQVLAREESFSRAADALNISQPSLSQYIKKIETEIGLPLFDRTNGNVRLTDAGHVYLSSGKQILDLEQQMNAHFQDLSENKAGTLKIGTSPFRSAAMMPAIAKYFRSIYPGMHLVIDEMESGELLESCAHGDFDFCLTVLPKDGTGFDYQTITREEMVLAVPAHMQQPNATPVAGRKYDAIDAGQLNGMPFVMITKFQVMQKALDSLCRSHNLHICKAAVVKSLEAQIAMVQAGVGVALVPTGIERFCNKDEVRFYSFVQPLPEREVVALWRKGRYLSRPARDLIEGMRNMNW
ncbi:MAG: LysR family transcriptional regulator [Clostridia bacterium]|nr:LysR family transcriptional regulator [Clostridia bacterium]